MRPFFSKLVQRRVLVALALLAVSAWLGVHAARVRRDYAVECLFPDRSETKRNHDRFKAIYPYDDARALVLVEAEDLWTPPGLRRVQALEEDLGKLPVVVDVEGPLSIKDVVDSGDQTVKIERLVPAVDLPAEELASRRARATTDPIFSVRVWKSGRMA